MHCPATWQHLVPAGLPIDAGTRLGPLVGSAWGTFGAFFFQNPWTLLARREAMEALQQAGVQGLSGRKPELRFRQKKNPPALVELQLEPHGLLHPDSLRVVTTSDDNTARVWKVDGSGQPIVLRGHEGTLTSATFSPDGLRVLTVSAVTARVWKADGSGQPMVLRGHKGSIFSAAFSPDGLRVLTASDDTTARMWPSTTSELQRILRHAFSDCLAPQMRSTYLDEDEAQARERYEACERSYGRPPLFTENP